MSQSKPRASLIVHRYQAAAFHDVRGGSADVRFRIARERMIRVETGARHSIRHWVGEMPASARDGIVIGANQKTIGFVLPIQVFEQWHEHLPIDRFDRFDFAIQAVDVRFFVRRVAVNEAHVELREMV